MLRTSAAVLGFAALSNAQFEPTNDPPSFDDYVGAYGKVYSSPEEAMYRQSIYQANVERIKDHNDKPDNTFVLGANQFADLTADEWSALYTARGLLPEEGPVEANNGGIGGYEGSGWEFPVPFSRWNGLRRPSATVRPDASPSSSPYPHPSASSSNQPMQPSMSSMPMPSASSSKAPSTSAMPSASSQPVQPSPGGPVAPSTGPATSPSAAPTNAANGWDWQAQGKVQAVKNQGSCGSCYSFAAAGAIESWTAINKGTMYSLSEQNIIDCESTNNGCGGGYITQTLQYGTNGLCKETDYPYTASKGSCRASGCVVADSKTNGAKTVAKSDTALMAAIRISPTVVGVEADQQAWQLYRSGVVTTSCGTSLDHAVLAVGYGTDANGGDYYRIKNSWGSSWGESGYIRLGRGSAFGSSGQCGILMQAAYPI